MAANQFIEQLHGETAFQGFTTAALLHAARSRYQQIDIFDTEAFGRVLVLDGIVQTTEKDEFMYHEMLVHVPMLAVKNARNVLIIGGGDGGSLREVLKHDIERVDMIEIDQDVVEACVRYLPSLNNDGDIYRDPRANLIVEDAFTYLERESRRYDVVISDSTDPIGAAAVLFSESFYLLCQRALNTGGAMSFQDGVVFLQPDEPRATLRALRKHGLHAACYLTSVPSYYGGPMTLAFATHDENVIQPTLSELEERHARLDTELKHYTPALHLASFALPKWISAITENDDD